MYNPITSLQRITHSIKYVNASLSFLTVAQKIEFFNLPTFQSMFKLLLG